VLWPTTMSQSESSRTINYLQSVTVTATLTTTGKNPTITGQFQFTGIPGPVKPTLTTDASGNQVLSATETITPPSTEFIQVTYSGDSNYNGASSADVVSVIVPDFSMNPNPVSLTMSAGQQASTTVALAPLSGSSSTVVLSCGQTPLVGISCAFSPASVNLANNAAVNATLTLTALGSSAPTPAAKVTRRSSVAGPLSTSWWTLGGILGTTTLLLLILPGRTRRYRLATALGVCSVIAAALGCGGGGSSGGGSGTGAGAGAGGGSDAPVPTSIVISAPSTKVPQGTLASVTATVTSSKPLTGTITFSDAVLGGVSPALTVTNGAAQTQLNLLFVGIHQITAQYSGDPSNQPSQSSPFNIAVTGTSSLAVVGTTGPLSHETSLNVTIQ
jgi:hypothetical protein